VHGDLCGPIKSATLGSKTPFLLMVDDMSRYMWLILLQAKCDAAKMIKHVQAQVEAESSKKLKVLCMDRGREFTSSSFIDYCNEVSVR
jgi:IS30 family transposase